MPDDRTILVLGANSFSGQDFVDLLLDDSANTVVGVSRSPERSPLFLRYKLRDNLTRYRYEALDLNRDMPRLLQLLDEVRPSHIVNFAAQSEVAPSWQHPEHWFQTNCVALAELVNHLRKQDYLKRYLHVSSPEIYGTCEGTVHEASPFNPSTPYAASKAAADYLLETYRRQFDFPLLTVRATNVYGARQQLFKIIPRSAIYIRNGVQIPLHGGGRAVKSYIHIRDVSRGERSILFDGTIGGVYHLSPDQGIAVRDVVATIANRLGRSLDEVAEITDERPGQDAAYVIDSTRARNEFGWRPEISFDTGASEVIEWVDAYWKEIDAQPLEYVHQP
ncbi:MAG: GDP-mannose 4,6-dehydratase [Planctomycetota bacterium]|nr:GDP-mannose 4,6-dehydratase [Planctomycetota bacterium]